jgi:hypothetical protein
MRRKIVTLRVRAEALMHRPKAASSQLPSLIMPCPVCTGRLVFQAVTPTKPPSELEDHVHACERCGTQVIRTTLCRAAATKTAAA